MIYSREKQFNSLAQIGAYITILDENYIEVIMGFMS